MMELLLEPSVEDFQTTKSRTIYPFQIFKNNNILHYLEYFYTNVKENKRFRLEVFNIM